MELILKLVFIQILMCSFLFAGGHQQSLENIYNELVATYSKMISLQGEFIQVNEWGGRNITLESRGYIYAVGDKYLLDYISPEGQKVIVDSLAYIVNENEKTLIISNIEEHLNPINIIRYYWEKSEKELITNDNSIAMIILYPKDEPDIKVIEVSIDKSNYSIIKIKYEDGDGNKVKFTFSNKSFNKYIDKNIFNIAEFNNYSIIDYTNK